MAMGWRELQVHLLQKRCTFSDTGAEARRKHTWLRVINITCKQRIRDRQQDQPLAGANRARVEKKMHLEEDKECVRELVGLHYLR